MYLQTARSLFYTAVTKNDSYESDFPVSDESLSIHSVDVQSKSHPPSAFPIDYDKWQEESASRGKRYL